MSIAIKQLHWNVYTVNPPNSAVFWMKEKMLKNRTIGGGALLGGLIFCTYIKKNWKYITIYIHTYCPTHHYCDLCLFTAQFSIYVHLDMIFGQNNRLKNLLKIKWMKKCPSKNRTIRGVALLGCTIRVGVTVFCFGWCMMAFWKYY